MVYSALRFSCIFFIVLLSLCINGQAQINTDAAMASLEGINLSFSKDSVIQQEGSFSFNTLKVTNTTTETKSVNLLLKYPESWQLLSDPSKLYTLEPGQSTLLPIRIAAADRANAKLRYLVYAIVTDPSQKGELQAFYHARVLPISKWTISLPTPAIFYEQGVTQTYFTLRIENKGNTDEDLKLDYVPTPGYRLYMPSRMLIKTEKDTTLIIKVDIDNTKMTGSNQVGIIIKAEDKAKKDKTVLQQITSLGSVIKKNPFLWYTLPMYIELQGQDLTAKRRGLVINSGGSIALKKNRSLSYSYRSNYISSNTDQTGSLLNITYSTAKMKISLGDQNEFYINSMEGRGLKAYYQTKRIGHEFMVVKRRDLDITNYGLKNTIGISQSQKFVSFASVTNDQTRAGQMLIYKGEYTIAFSNNTRLVAEAGYGVENIKTNTMGNLALAGQGIAGTFQGNFSGLNINIVGNLSSKYYPTLTRGVSSIDNDIRYAFGSFYSGIGYRYTTRRPALYENEEFLRVTDFTTRQMELKLGLTAQTFSVDVYPGYVDEVQDSVSTKTARVINSSRIKLNKDLSLLVFANVARTHAYSFPGSNPINSLNSRLTLQAAFYGLITRYDAGPYLATDIARYVKFGAYPQRLYMGPYVEKTAIGGRLYMRLQAEYNNEFNNQGAYSFRNELSYSLVKSGMRVKVFTTYNPQRQIDKFFINAALRKSFEIPLAGLPKYSNLAVVLYKDVNNNTLFDEDDEAIADAIVVVDSKYFQTNAKGEIAYKNIERATYELNVTTVSSLKGWISKNGITQKITVGNSKRYYVPFIQSKFITGVIQVNKDKYSPYNFSLESIRITATDQGGKEYSTLTTSDGRFFLNLPADIYTLRINTSVFGEIYEVVNPTVSINLLEANSYDVTFDVKEKRRKINIRRN